MENLQEARVNQAPGPRACKAEGKPRTKVVRQQRPGRAWGAEKKQYENYTKAGIAQVRYCNDLW